MIADFSSSGPTPTSLQLKPDVTAPGRRHPLVLPGQPVVTDSRERAWRRHTSRAQPLAPRAASDLDGRADQVGARLDGRPRPRPVVDRRGVGASRGRRADRSRSCRQPTRLHRPDRRLVRARASGSTTIAAARTHGCRRRRRHRGRRRSRRRRRRPASPIPLDADAAVPARRSASPSRRGRRGGGRRHRLRPLTRGADVRRIPYWAHVEEPKLGLSRARRSAARPLRWQHRRQEVSRLELPLSGGRRYSKACRPTFRGRSRCSGSRSRRRSRTSAPSWSRGRPASASRRGSWSPATRTASSATRRCR